MTLAKTKIHPVTGKILMRGKRKMKVEFQGMSRVVEVKGWFPKDGGDGLMWRDDGAAADAALDEMKTEHAAKMRSFAARVAGKIMAVSNTKISSKQLSRLLTGSPNSFDKYRRGDAQPSHPTLVLLSILEKHPKLFLEIKALADKSAA